MRLRNCVTCVLLVMNALSSAQTDSISTNIYQYNGNLGIGTAFPGSKFTLVTDEVVTYPQFGIMSIRNNHYATYDGFSASDIHYVGSLINGRRSRGTVDFPQDVVTGDRLTGIVSSMFYNNEFRFNSSILFYAGRGLDYGSYPSYIVFNTTDRYETVSSERMRLAENGYLGIGTGDPAARLQIADGDIYLEDINRGIIMKSPDGQCWKGVMSNEGNLVFSAVDCPEYVPVNSKITVKNNVETVVFPNPARDVLNVSLSDVYNGVIHYSVQDINGRICLSSAAGPGNFLIDLNRLNPGPYVLNVRDRYGEIIISEKIVKQ
ncbi:MAG: T9SS type A sorting domain-containing protein [Lentimicrobium sp.]|uniref:T9SS type A sorting domain-containing protein n=1 Tax=Lentimicrobium sp. TaxID=2034841 RepID=UPI002600210E|nr:T9SS type A sorting domain-containing protein [Lentimicrobium sp.]MCO5257990.1 T9SS type A sorting domain-containing protein [Lentimicrobium sp.]MCO5263065.1 T9SS type A sorting domain-containing protein [Lentimicrobium sp.]